MLRFVIMLGPDFGENPHDDPTPHHFHEYAEAERFGVKNNHRFKEFYSEKHVAQGGADYWARHATYNLFVDPDA